MSPKYLFSKTVSTVTQLFFPSGFENLLPHKKFCRHSNLLSCVMFRLGQVVFIPSNLKKSWSTVHPHLSDTMSKNQIKCSSCQLIFSTNHELLNHIKFSTGECAISSRIIRCKHCSKDFMNRKGLDNHLRMNPYCSALEDPHKMSLVGFPPNKDNGSSNGDFVFQESSAVSSKTKRKFDSDRFLSIGSESSSYSGSAFGQLQCQGSHSSNPNDVLQKYSLNELKSISFHRRSKSSNSNGDNTVLDRFSSHPELMVSFNVKYIQSEPTMKLIPQDQQLMDILSKYTKFSNPSVCAPVSIVVMDLTNNLAMRMMDGFLQTIPGESSGHRNISRSDILSFVLRYGTFWIPASSKLVENIDMDNEWSYSDDIVTLEEYVETVEEVVAIQGEQRPPGDVDDEEDIVFAYDSDGDHSFAAEEVTVHVTDAVDTVMNRYQKMIDHTRMTAIYNTNDIANLELYQMLQSSGAPSYLFDEIQDWATKHCSKLMCQGGMKLQRRKAFVNNMAMKVYGDQFSDKMKPSLKTLTLPSGNQIEVIVCSFKAQLVSLMTDMSLMSAENLLLDRNDPFKEVPDGILSELNTGWWHRETRQEVCSDFSKHILLPIVFFLDASNVDKNGRLQVNPLTFTLGIFNRSIRNQARAWRTVGYIDDHLNYLDNDLREELKSFEKVQDVHAIVAFVLEEFKSIQGKDGGFSWTLDLGGRKFDVIFKLAVQVVIGDCKGNDLLCGRYGSHGMNVKRLCRDCDVLTIEGDNCDHFCNFLSKNDIEDKSKEHMNDLSFHCIQNAFSGVYFGARNLSIVEATPPEPLHGYRLGICKYLFEQFERQCAKRTLKLVNFTVMRIARYSCRSSVRNLPSLQPFKRKGVTKCNTLSADEQLARVFAVYLSIMIPSVFESMVKADRHKKIVVVNEDGSVTSQFQNIGPLGFERSKKWLDLFSRTLTFNAWIMSPEHPKHHLEGRVTRMRHDRDLEREPICLKRVREYMRLYKAVIYRTHGNGLCIPKFHQLLHYVRQILKDGSLLNIDGGRCESIATTSHTNPGKRTQMRLDSFLKQLSICHYSDVTVNSASENSKIPYGRLTMPLEEPDATILENTAKLCGSRFVLSIDQSSTDSQNNFIINFVWQGKQPKHGFDKHLCSCISQRLWNNQRDMNILKKGSSILGYTEYSMGETIFRAHPSFRDDGSWFDWAALAWEGSGQAVPAKLMMFIDLSYSDFNDDHNENHVANHPDIQYLKKDKYVVIQTSLEDFEDNARSDRYRREDKLASRIRLEQAWRIVPITSIRFPIFVIPEDESQKNKDTIDHFVIQDKLEWSELFWN